jgi:hypothetical protein
LVSKSNLLLMKHDFAHFIRANQHPFQKQLLSMICQSFDNLIDVFPREFLIINGDNIPPQESKPELHQPCFYFSCKYKIVVSVIFCTKREPLLDG